MDTEQKGKKKTAPAAEKAKTPKKETAAPPKAEAENSAALDQMEKELKEAKDMLLRTAAEFDNYKKRTERDRIAALEYAKAQMIKPLLPILDNIDRASACEPGSADYNKGIEMIVKQFCELGSQLGITPIGEVGDSFDPNIHEAVMHIEDENLGENVVAQVLQKGYKLGDTVIRTAMVQVAN